MFVFGKSKKPEFHINNKIRLIELFGGLGTQAMSLRDIGVLFEHYRLCEFDKFAVDSYNSIHQTNFVTTDIRELKGEDLGITNTNDFTYILTYSFPCTDLSSAGAQAGMAKGSGTRSSLLWEVERLLNEVDTLPQVLVMENVVNVHDANNLCHFQTWLDFLEQKGYSNYYQDLNGSDFGVPHNRKRCFVVSLLGDYDYEFPNPLKTKKPCIQDILDESSVSSKDYYDDENVDNFLKSIMGKKFNSTILGYIDKGTGKHQSNTVYNSKLACPCLCAGDYKSPKKIIVSDCGDPYDIIQSATDFEKDVKGKVKVRRMTNKEYWRLMGYTDDDYEKVKNITSQTQLYKQCGNAIVKNCLSAIFQQLGIHNIPKWNDIYK